MKRLVWFLLSIVLLAGCEGLNKASIFEELESSATPGELVFVEKGRFLMGDTWNIGLQDDKPVHIVAFTYDFFMGKYEVTFKEYDEFCDEIGKPKPAEEIVRRALLPVIAVTWWDAIDYCNWLSENENLPRAYDVNGNLLDIGGNITNDPSKVAGYRLPTEAEWEYAARGGSKGKDYRYAGSNNKDEVAWHKDNFRDRYHEVGLKLPNELGLFDMSGNVWEWCSDGFYKYSDKPITDPYYIGDSALKTFRGGSLKSSDSELYLSRRLFAPASERYIDAGFRVCRTSIEQDLPYVSKLKGLEGAISDRENTFNWSGYIIEGKIESYEYRMDKSEWIDCALNDSFIWRNYSSGKHVFEVRAKSGDDKYSKAVSWEFFAIEMIEVSSGSYTMGDVFGGGYGEELPTHFVVLDYSFCLSSHEVTFNEYDVFCEVTGRSKPKDEGWGRGQRPVINVSWWDAIEYCNWLSELASLPKAYSKTGGFLDRFGKLTSDPSEVVGFRLPTEAEWEFAARGGTKSQNYQYSGSQRAEDVAWYKANSENMTHAVGSLQPNELRLFDMSGNVWEWCSDLFSIYIAKEQVNPFKSHSSSRSRVIRGGSWANNESYLRVSCRFSKEPEEANDSLGFRICRTNIDIRLPVIEEVSGPNGKVLGSEVTFEWRGSDHDGLIIGYEYRKDGGEWEKIPGPKDSYLWRDLSGGSHTFEVRAVDNDGFLSEKISWFFWRVVAGDMVLVERDSLLVGDTTLETRNLMDHDFSIGQYEVTIAEFREFCSATAREKPNTGLASSVECPVFNVSWWDSIAYCNWLSDSQGIPRAYNSAGQLLSAEGRVTEDLKEVAGYRLPSEAEWEYAARGGVGSKGYIYSGGDNVNLVAWYYDNTTPRRMKEIGQKMPNELDLFDMSGNVWEWCTDSNKANKVIRGGSYEDRKANVTITSRKTNSPEARSESIGFRICITGNYEKNYSYKETATSTAQSFNIDTSYKSAILGLTVSDILEADRKKVALPTGIFGVIVKRVDINGLAYRIGFSEDDVIWRLSINGNQEAINGIDSFADALESIKNGDYMAVFIYRDGERFVASFTVSDK